MSSAGATRRAPQPHRVEPLPGWKREPAAKRSRTPAVTLAVVGILVVVALGKFLVDFATRNGVHYERARLQARTQAIANALDVESIKALAGDPADANTPAFNSLLARLTEVRETNPGVRFSYLMGWKDGAVVFLLDSTDPNSTDYSPPGEVYDEASAELIASFTKGEPFVEGPVTDRWGTWVSGLAPVKDPDSGRVIAMLGMDVDATRWKVTVGACRVLAYGTIAVLLFVVVFFARRLQALQ